MRGHWNNPQETKHAFGNGFFARVISATGMQTDIFIGLGNIGLSLLKR
jgi:hypothetical protein